jgi:hypothetical protein
MTEAERNLLLRCAEMLLRDTSLNQAEFALMLGLLTEVWRGALTQPEIVASPAPAC